MVFGKPKTISEGSSQSNKIQPHDRYSWVVEVVTAAVRAINANQNLTGSEKTRAIKELQGVPKEKMVEVIESLFGTAPPGTFNKLGKYVGRTS